MVVAWNLFVMSELSILTKHIISCRINTLNNTTKEPGVNIIYRRLDTLNGTTKDPAVNIIYCQLNTLNGTPRDPAEDSRGLTF